MSFALTTPQFLDGTKTVTRRLGWLNLSKGDRVKAVEKGMGLKKGERVKCLGMISVKNIRRERLCDISFCDVSREGFRSMSREEFIVFFCKHNHCQPTDLVTRIEFVKLGQVA